MSNIHMLDKNVNNKTINCIFHVGVPTSDNRVGTAWVDAVKQHFLPVALIDSNDATENAAIENGEILEVAHTVRFSTTNLTNAERLTEVQSFYETKSAELLAELASKLNFYGREA